MSCFLHYAEESEHRCCTKDTMVAGFPLAQSVELPLFASFVLKYVLGSKGAVPKSSVAQLPVVAVHSLLFLTFYTVLTVDGVLQGTTVEFRKGWVP